MDTQNHIIEHRKGQHLLAEERHEIEVRLKDGWSPYRIAKHLGRAYNTIKAEIARGTVYSHDGKVAQYNAEAGEQQYKENCKRLEVSPFIEYVEENFAEGWSLDACVGNALESGEFCRDQLVCTKTLYNYVDNGLIGIKNIDLPEKLKRNTKK